MEVLIPVLLSLLLGPGTGQLYNREYRKGTYLIVLSLVILIAAMAWMRQALLPYFPSDLSTVGDRAAVQLILQNAITQISAEHSGTISVYEILLFGTWVYGVIDSFRVGMRRYVLKQQPPAPPQNPS